jgi:hypothetical protein
VIGQTYPATPYLQRLTAAHGWQGELIFDEHGNPLVIVAVRIGPSWTDAVAIEGEDRCVAMRRRTRGSDPIVPSGGAVWRRVGPGLRAEPPDSSGAVWRRDGRCEDVLAELLELPGP